MADTRRADEPAQLPPGAPAHDRDLEEGRMPFLEHLRELRLRLRNSAIALFGGFIIAYAFSQELFVLLMEPLTAAWQHQGETNPALAGQQNMVFGSVIEPFWTYLNLAIWAGVFVASPFIFLQLWKFIAPGLYKHERRIGVTFALVSATFFTGGAAFCYFFVLPEVLLFLLDYATANLAEVQKLGSTLQVSDQQVGLVPLLSMQEYLSFARKLLLGFGLIFELPLVIFFLSLTGAITHRGMWKFNRWWVVLSFVISAALTPPDWISQTLMAGPLIVLYNLSIGIAYVVTRRREAQLAAPPT